jgi:hypothetical protein
LCQIPGFPGEMTKGFPDYLPKGFPIRNFLRRWKTIPRIGGENDLIFFKLINYIGKFH